MENMKNIVIDVDRDTDLEGMIVFWENRFEEDVRHAAEAILEGGNVTTVALSGPSCSGKTTTAKKLEAILSGAGRRIVPISIDDFYLDLTKDDRIRLINFESPGALDIDLFKSFVAAVNEGRPAVAPVFDFKKKCRAGYRKIIPQENDIYIFEGIQALYPELYEYYDASKTKRVFINVHSSVTANGVKFESEEIRLLRRLLRDYNHRASDAEFTLRLWDDVRENEENRILPVGEGADIKINSVIPYDVFVMGKPDVAILGEVDLYSPRYPAASFMKRKIQQIVPATIPVAMVPPTSLLTEFIG